MRLRTAWIQSKSFFNQTPKTDRRFIFSFWDEAQFAKAAKKCRAAAESPFPSQGLGHATIDLVAFAPCSVVGAPAWVWTWTRSLTCWVNSPIAMERTPMDCCVSQIILMTASMVGTAVGAGYSWGAAKPAADAVLEPVAGFGAVRNWAQAG